MISEFDALEDGVKKSEKISVICHKKPDGDAIGSLVSFVSYLRYAGKEACGFCVDKVPEYLKFLPGSDFISNDFGEFFNASDLVVFVDCGDLKMTGMQFCSFDGKKIMQIDHHASNCGYSSVNVVDHYSSATSEVLYNYFKHVGFDIDKDIATNLFCGVYTDTDSFTNLATTPPSLKVASDLLARGANFKEISANTMRNKSISSLKLWGKALERLKLDVKKGVAATVIKESDFKECEASCDDSEGVANLLNHLADVNMSMVLRETGEGTIKGSLRTTKDNVDVSRIAKLMGGGGHKKAAGFTVRGKIKEAENGWEVVSL